MTPQAAYEHCNITGENEFTFTKGDKSLRVVFMESYDAGEVYLPGQGKRAVVQQFYDGWEAVPASRHAPGEQESI